MTDHFCSSVFAACWATSDAVSARLRTRWRRKRKLWFACLRILLLASLFRKSVVSFALPRLRAASHHLFALHPGQGRSHVQSSLNLARPHRLVITIAPRCPARASARSEVSYEAPSPVSSSRSWPLALARPRSAPGRGPDLRAPGLGREERRTREGPRRRAGPLRPRGREPVRRRRPRQRDHRPQAAAPGAQPGGAQGRARAPREGPGGRERSHRAPGPRDPGRLREGHDRRQRAQLPAAGAATSTRCRWCSSGCAACSTIRSPPERRPAALARLKRYTGPRAGLHAGRSSSPATASASGSPPLACRAR